MANNDIIYNLHDFRDVNDSMRNVINSINVLKQDGKIEEANNYAETNKNILGDMLSPGTINDFEDGIIKIQKATIAKKRSVVIDPEYPFLYNTQSWIQPFADGHTHLWNIEEYSVNSEFRLRKVCTVCGETHELEGGEL